MTDNYEYIDVNDEQWEGTPRPLREALDRAQKALKDRDKAIASFQSERADTALSDVLTGFSKPERVKADILRDKVDPLDSEAVSAWMEENADAYARATPPADPSTDTTGEATPAKQAPDYAALNGVAQIGTPAAADNLAAIAAMPDGLSKTEAYQWLAARAK